MRVMVAARDATGAVATVGSFRKLGLSPDGVMLTSLMQAHALATDTRAAWSEWTHMRRRGTYVLTLVHTLPTVCHTVSGRSMPRSLSRLW